MLAKKNKLDLRHQTDFFKTARRNSTDQFTIYWKKALAPNIGPLFQVTLAKGTVLTIVERNALKRVVYNLCALLLQKHPTSNLLIAIVIRQKDAIKLLPSLTTELTRLLAEKS